MARTKSNLTEAQKAEQKKLKDEKKKLEQAQAKEELNAISELKLSDCLSEEQIKNLSDTLKKDYPNLTVNALVSVLCNRFLNKEIQLASRMIWE